MKGPRQTYNKNVCTYKQKIFMINELIFTQAIFFFKF